MKKAVKNMMIREERCNFKLKLRKDYLASLLKAENKISEKNEENINKIDKIHSKVESKEKEKNKSRKNSQNEQIQMNNKKEIENNSDKNKFKE